MQSDLDKRSSKKVAIWLFIERWRHGSRRGTPVGGDTNRQQIEIHPGSSGKVAAWLFIGVGMLVIQIMLGGITRLTQSGLSITEWNPIMGAIPPLNTHQWMVEFDKYKHTDQFRYLNSDFTLGDFKNIFFWEWFHRLWARLMAVVFLAGFFYFLFKKQLNSRMILPFVILFFLGMMQGAIGWIMVKSGLVPERLFVGHIQLATHFIAALILLCYTLWFALNLSVPVDEITVNSGLKRLTVIIVCLLFVQLIYGAFMAGLHAATAAPTWPQINGQWIPHAMDTLSPPWKNFTDNKITVQFIHRGIAYTLLVMVIIWFAKAIKIKGTLLFIKTKWIPLLLILAQVMLGILTVVTSPNRNNLVWFGVAHQLVAILFLISIVFMLYVLRPSPVPDHHK
ncbi:MAG TPA: COX15/CtaA family protein [Chitinophagaceae bacterium]|nr:COX15/CtaA family protein [Chitinophagaceae bacterium]